MTKGWDHVGERRIGKEREGGRKEGRSHVCMYNGAENAMFERGYIRSNDCQKEIQVVVDTRMMEKTVATLLLT